MDEQKRSYPGRKIALLGVDEKVVDVKMLPTADFIHGKTEVEKGYSIKNITLDKKEKEHEKGTFNVSKTPSASKMIGGKTQHQKVYKNSSSRRMDALRTK